MSGIARDHGVGDIHAVQQASYLGYFASPWWFADLVNDDITVSVIDREMGVWTELWT